MATIFFWVYIETSRIRLRLSSRLRKSTSIGFYLNALILTTFTKTWVIFRGLTNVDAETENNTEPVETNFSNTEDVDNIADDPSMEFDETLERPPKRQKITSPTEVTKKSKNQNIIVSMMKDRMEGQTKLLECVEKLMPQQSTPVVETDVDLFFKSMAATVKTFAPHQVAEVKMKVCNIVSNIEIHNAYQQQSFSASTTQNPTPRPQSGVSTPASSTRDSSIIYEEKDDNDSWLLQLN